MGIVAFAGSRGLSPAFAGLVSGVVKSVVKSGRKISVGCCVGLDEFVLGSGSAVSSVRCFSAFGQNGVGSCSLSALPVINEFLLYGGQVNYWAGGKGHLKSRLSNCTQAVINSASVSAVVFFSSANSIGSLLACRLAVRRGLPVFAFACGFSCSGLPSLGAGAWVVVGGSGAWGSSCRWVSSQNDVFL